MKTKKNIEQFKYFCIDCGIEVSELSGKYGKGRCQACATKYRWLTGQFLYDKLGHKKEKYKYKHRTTTCAHCGKLVKYNVKSKKNNNEIFCSHKCSYEKVKIDRFKKIKTTIHKLKKSNFIIWFTGFWEGEGSISFHINKRTPVFCLWQNDKKIIHYIYNSFSFGKIYIQHGNTLSKNNSYIYRSNSLIEIAGILWLILPHVRSFKRLKQIKRVIKFYKLQQYINWF